MRNLSVLTMLNTLRVFVLALFVTGSGLFAFWGPVPVAASPIPAVDPHTLDGYHTTYNTPDHPCAKNPAVATANTNPGKCYGEVDVDTSAPTSTGAATPSATPSGAPLSAAPAPSYAAGTRYYVYQTETWTEHGYDYPGDDLYTITLKSEQYHDTTAPNGTGYVYIDPSCKTSSGFKGWSCGAMTRGDFYDSTPSIQAQTAWVNYETNWSYPCPGCSEQDFTYLRNYLQANCHSWSWAGH